jgi:hypothetical protein
VVAEEVVVFENVVDSVDLAVEDVSEILELLKPPRVVLLISDGTEYSAALSAITDRCIN